MSRSGSSRHFVWFGSGATVLFGLTSAPLVSAMEAGTFAGKPLRLEITEAASVYYNIDNRNGRTGNVARSVDDDWGVVYNRLNLQASTGHFQAGLRLDGAWFYASKSPTEIGLDLLEERAGRRGGPYTDEDGTFFAAKTAEASRDLSTRFTTWLYPAKYYIGYTTRDVEATVGDFYAQLGRGFVLSVRKLDELSSDTTVRGARTTGRFRAGPVRLKLTALGGEMNPLRIDEASGRYLGTIPSVRDGFTSITEAGMPYAQASPFEAHAAPTYAPDRVVAAQIEGGTDAIVLGAQGSQLIRTLPQNDTGTSTALSPGAVRSAERIQTGSISLSAPDLEGHGSLYTEVAFQGLSYPGTTDHSELPDPGHAVYASVSANAGPVAATLEAKHYRRFFPLLANVDVGRAPEFSALQYSAPPTTEAIYVDTAFEGLNTCVTGGRMKTDVTVGRGATVFAWTGHYRTWAESVSNENCRTSDSNLNRIWDFAAGFELSGRSTRSRATATVGSRFDDTERFVTDPASLSTTQVFYREAYLRFDILIPLGGPFTLKAQGWDRRRHQVLGGPRFPWTELQQLVGIDYEGRLSAALGFEYTGNPQFPSTYFNGSFGYNLTSASNLSLFVGQRRGGLRCVSGICRVYPPFEGVRLDATFRF